MTGDFPKLMILLLTYASETKSERAGYAEKTLRSALDNIRYSGQISVHIADDGSAKGHVAKLEKIAGGYATVHGVSTSNAGRGGYGKSYNLATQQIHEHSEVVLVLEDDWELRQPLDLGPFVQTLVDARPVIGCIRLGYLGSTKELRGSIGHNSGKTYLVFDPESPEHHVAAGHPRIETVEWERNVGPWPEGVDPGTTEFVWCGYPGARSGVAWDIEAPAGGYFKHIGTVQARADQLHEVTA